MKINNLELSARSASSNADAVEWLEESSNRIKMVCPTCNQRTYYPYIGVCLTCEKIDKWS